MIENLNDMADEQKVNMCKCKIVALDSGLSYFITEDLIEKSIKQVTLSGKQRLSYKQYSIGDVIYAVKGNIERTWKLVAESDFKRSQILIDLRAKLDDNFNLGTDSL